MQLTYKFTAVRHDTGEVYEFRYDDSDASRVKMRQKLDEMAADPELSFCQTDAEEAKVAMEILAGGAA
jgi:YD repeat-containing protein